MDITEDMVLKYLWDSGRYYLWLRCHMGRLWRRLYIRLHR